MSAKEISDFHKEVMQNIFTAMDETIANNKSIGLREVHLIMLYTSTIVEFAKCNLHVLFKSIFTKDLPNEFKIEVLDELFRDLNEVHFMYLDKIKSTAVANDTFDS